MTTLVSLLNEVRKRAPVGSPLYAFRHTLEQHQELVSILQREFSRGNRDRHLSAGYCLAASRILSIEHPRGPWSWRPVDEYFGKIKSPGPFVKMGLEYWGRPVVVLETHRWLFTLIAEGGLPIHLVQEQGSTISTFFSRLLALSESHPQGDVADEIPRCFGMLPPSLRNDAVRQLSVDLVSSVRELRVASDGESDRLAFLDLERPGWRERLPLHVEDEVSRELLSGLLAAPKQNENLAAAGIPVVTSLERRALDLDEYSITQTVRLPTYVSRQGLSRQLGMDVECLPKRFTLHLVDLEGTITPLATVTHAAEEHDFYLETGRRNVHLGQKKGPVLLQVARRGEELSPAVRISQELGDMPWVFADDEIDQELISVGPCATSRKSVLIAATDEASVHALTDEVYDSRATLMGILLEEDRYLYRIHGRVRVQVAGEHFSVRTNATHDESYSVQMRGSRIALQSRLAWRGVPRFFIADFQGERELPTAALSWRPKGNSAAWRTLDRRCVGEVQIRVCWNDQVVHRSSECILPAAFSFELQPGPQSGSGQLLLCNVGSCRVSGVEGNENLELRFRSADAREVSISCRARAECSAVPLRLNFGETELFASFPFPGHYLGFVDAAGRPLTPGSHLDVTRLHGVRARAVSGDRTDEFLLLARADSMREKTLATVRRGVDGIAEVSLGHVQQQVEALLSEGLDAMAELYLEPKGGVVRRAVRKRGIKVHWYGNRLVRHFDEEPQGEEEGKTLVSSGDIPISLKVPNDTDVPVRVFAHRMNDPLMEERVELPGDQEAGWLFSTTNREPGPWIVTGFRGEVLLCRPSLVVVPRKTGEEAAAETAERAPEFATSTAATDETTPPSKIYLARDSVSPPSSLWSGQLEEVPPLEVIVEHPSRRERQRLLRALVERMAQDASHPGWEFAQGFLDSMRLFPADSYEFNRAVFESSQATALAMLRGAFFGRLDHLYSGFEQFHFLWVTFPLRAWTRAARIYRDTAFPTVPEESRAPLLKLVMERCFSAGETTKYRSVIWDVCARTIHGVPRPPSPIAMPDREQRRMLARVIAQNAMQQVEQQHAEEMYPYLPPTDDLLTSEIGGAVDALSPHVQMGFRRDVARAPIVAAAISVHALSPSHELLFELRRVRDFDSNYFDSVYNDSLACLALDALDDNHDHFN